MGTAQNHQKRECRAAAVKEFEGTGIQMSEDGEDLANKSGQRHLGAAIGSPAFVATYLEGKVTAWVEQGLGLLTLPPPNPMLHTLVSCLDYSIDGHLFKEPCLPRGTTCNH